MATTYSHSSLIPLPKPIHDGMIAMGLFGLISFICTVSLIVFITYRMITWKRYYDHPIHKNQVFVLIYNLLIADVQQALSFLISFHWIGQGKLVGPNSYCFAQGWLIQIGDLSSGLWVLAIAVHTFVSLVGQKQLSHKMFVLCVVSLWGFCLFLTVIGPLLSKDDFFVPAGAWCWISETHETERLYLHYLWIFISQLGSLVIYISLFFFLRGRLSNGMLSNTSISTTSQNDKADNKGFKNIALTTTTIVSPSNDAFAQSRQRLLRTARNMVYYPFAYVTLTLPLASGRVSAMAGRTPPLDFFPVAGSLIACCGAIDVIMYISTRKALVRSSVGIKGSGTSLEHMNALRRFRANEQDIKMGRMDGHVRDDTSHGGFGGIVVNTVVTSEETMDQGSGEGSSRSERSESLKSLVPRKEENEDFEAREKSWLV